MQIANLWNYLKNEIFAIKLYAIKNQTRVQSFAIIFSFVMVKKPTADDVTFWNAILHFSKCCPSIFLNPATKLDKKYMFKNKIMIFDILP